MLVQYLEVMFDPLRVEALWDHYNSSLYVEAQGHLGTTFVVFFPNGYKHLIVQQRRTFQIHPIKETQLNTHHVIYQMNST